MVEGGSSWSGMVGLFCFGLVWSVVGLLAAAVAGCKKAKSEKMMAATSVIAVSFVIAVFVGETGWVAVFLFLGEKVTQQVLKVR